MSRALREIIDAHLTGQEGLDWLAAMISGRGEQREYYIPRFGKKLDVLDPDKSTFVPGTAHVIKPVFSLQKLAGLSVFYNQDLFWQIPSRIYVNKAIRQSALEKGLTGLDFSPARVA